MWDGSLVVDLDAHVQEDPGAMYPDRIDPEYRDKLDRLVSAMQENADRGLPNRVAGFRYGVIAQIVSDEVLGEVDSFGRVPRSVGRTAGGRTNFGRPDSPDLPDIDHRAGSEVAARLAGMDAASIDISVLYPTLVSSYCALHDVRFESALYRAYHRWVSDHCAEAPDRLKWTLVANMRDPDEAAREIERWADRDENLVGIYLPPCGPNGMLLDDPALFPIYTAAQAHELPLLVHGGTARPPYQPGTFDLGGKWFLLHGLSNPWAGMAALGALLGGGIFERFPELRAAAVETAAGWLPAILDRFDTHYYMSPAHVPHLHERPSRFVKESGRYFHGIDTWETTLEYLVEAIGDDVLVFATDWPHGDTAWPEAVQQVVSWPGIPDDSKRKILGANALRLCPRLAASVTQPVRP